MTWQRGGSRLHQTATPAVGHAAVCIIRFGSCCPQLPKDNLVVLLSPWHTSRTITKISNCINISTSTTLINQSNKQEPGKINHSRQTMPIRETRYAHEMVFIYPIMLMKCFTKPAKSSNSLDDIDDLPTLQELEAAGYTSTTESNVTQWPNISLEDPYLASFEPSRPTPGTLLQNPTSVPRNLPSTQGYYVGLQTGQHAPDILVSDPEGVEVDVGKTLGQEYERCCQGEAQAVELGAQHVPPDLPNTTFIASHCGPPSEWTSTTSITRESSLTPGIGAGLEGTPITSSGTGNSTPWSSPHERFQQTSEGYYCGHRGCVKKPKLFKNWSDLKHHQRCHIPNHARPYKCQLCPKGFLHPKCLKRHMQSVTHSPRQFACRNCGETFGRVDNRNRHRNNGCRQTCPSIPRSVPRPHMGSPSSSRIALRPRAQTQRTLPFTLAPLQTLLQEDGDVDIDSQWEDSAEDSPSPTPMRQHLSDSAW